MSDEPTKSKGRERLEILIDAKLSILDDWARRGIPWKRDPAGNYIFDSEGERTIDYYPDDIKAFCAWDGKENCDHTVQDIVEFCRQRGINTPRSLSRSTLGKAYHKVRFDKVTSLLKVLSAKAASQIQHTNKSNIIESLETDLDYWKTLALHQEAVDIVLQRRRAARAEKDLAKKTRELARHQAEARREIIALEAKVAELTATLAKVRPLREGKNAK